MRLSLHPGSRSPALPDPCDERRVRRHGYQLHCLEPAGHDGPHRWTPELVERSARRDGARPPARPVVEATTSLAGSLAGRVLRTLRS